MREKMSERWIRGTMVLLLLAVWIAGPIGAQAEQWDTLFAGKVPGNAGRVNALVEFNGELIVGGNFTEIGGVPAQNIATFFGGTWQALGGELCGEVTALVVWNGDLYAGGRFPCDQAACDAVCGGPGEPNPGGEEIGGYSAILARWSGNSWEKAGGFANEGAIVHALAVYQGDLYLGGFIAAGQTSSLDGLPQFEDAAGLLRLSPSADVFWVPATVGGVANGDPHDPVPMPCSGGPVAPGIYDMVVWGNHLYIAGQFTHADLPGVCDPGCSFGDAVPDSAGIVRMAIINGSPFWEGLPGGDILYEPFCDFCTGSLCAVKEEDICGGRALAVWEDGLYLGGNFRFVGFDDSCPANAVDARNIARWDGSDWHALLTQVPMNSYDFEPGVGGITGPERLDSEGTVLALATTPTYQESDSNVPGKLWIGGNFGVRGGTGQVEGLEVNNIVTWDKDKFQNLANGVSPTSNAEVKVLLPYPAVLGPTDVYVGGDFCDVEIGACDVCGGDCRRIFHYCLQDLARWGSYPLSPPPNRCDADFNLSGEVDIADFLLVQTEWGECSDPESCADLDCDNMTGIVEFLEVLSSWGTCGCGCR